MHCVCVIEIERERERVCKMFFFSVLNMGTKEEKQTYYKWFDLLPSTIIPWWTTGCVNGSII